MYKEISNCRVSGSPNLIPVLHLGEQYLTGIFPKSKNQNISKGPMDLVWCPESKLLQLKQSYSLDEMYGDDYGYRSGLNSSMVNHLRSKVNYLEMLKHLKSGDLVLDIGSNDATTLKCYKRSDIVRVGIDPTGEKFRDYYTNGLHLIPEFFPSNSFKNKFNNKKAKIITSIAMFYDLESPIKFIEEICKHLDNDGIWHFEQSYMPSMLRTNAYDTICHEHLEYYSLHPIQTMLKDHDLKIIDVQINDINGGSFAITACHKKNKNYTENKPVVNWLLSQEERMGLDTPKPFRDFEERVYNHKTELWSLIRALKDDGKTIVGYGASTKGNVLLQFCNFTENEIPFIAEINPDKFGSYTPGTNIPIISEDEAKRMNPDYYFVLPWHFKNNIISREQEYRHNGGKFIFPLPNIEII
jgi:hypothetical protein